eukprot:UN2537
MTEMKEIVVAVIGTTLGFITAAGGEPTLVTVGHIPSGLPSFQAPWDIPAYQGLVSEPSRLYSFMMGGVLVALTSFLTAYATTKKMALQYGYELDPSQEMIALGSAGIAGSFFRASDPPPSGPCSYCGSHAYIVNPASIGKVIHRIEASKLMHVDCLLSAPTPPMENPRELPEIRAYTARPILVLQNEDFPSDRIA